MKISPYICTSEIISEKFYESHQPWREQFASQQLYGANARQEDPKR